MPDQPNYYALLGLPRNASPEDIRRAYFEAARRLHPDKNVAPGDTEYFIGIQEAYEVLSNPKKRTKYDAALPPVASPAAPVLQKILFSRRSILQLEEPQLIYVLLELIPVTDANAAPTPPLNLCLVLDRSTSMQGINLDVVKATAIQLLRRLRPQDTLAVVAFSDRAETIIPSTSNANISKLEARIQMLQTSGGTEIFNGLEAGYNEIRRSHNPAHVNHIILLTDGRTYGDEENCLHLADKAAKQSIGISGLGIGFEWNDVFLDALASRTGGSSMYVAKPQDIQRLLVEKFNRLWQIYADDVTLEFQNIDGVELRYAFRLQPEVGLLPVESPLRMGPILRDTSLTVLMEFLIQPTLIQAEIVSLLGGTLKITISAQPTPIPPMDFRLARPVTSTIAAEPPPQEIVQALSRLTLYRLQEQARLEVTAGEYERASQHLQRLATHLLAQGERGLARTALLEAEHIQRSKSFSKEGDKQIKYGTRALLVSGQEIKKS